MKGICHLAMDWVSHKLMHHCRYRWIKDKWNKEKEAKDTNNCECTKKQRCVIFNLLQSGWGLLRLPHRWINFRHFVILIALYFVFQNILRSQTYIIHCNILSPKCCSYDLITLLRWIDTKISWFIFKTMKWLSPKCCQAATALRLYSTGDYSLDWHWQHQHQGNAKESFSWLCTCASYLAIWQKFE